MKLKKRLKKPEQRAKTESCFKPGSVSRLAGSAHRWGELYAGKGHRKTTGSRTNCSSVGNNRRGTFQVLPKTDCPKGAKAGFSHPHSMETLMQIWNGAIDSFLAGKRRGSR
ncbi:hypothetical protein [Acidovorax sp. GW101-3H11]|uniref:hypothetical protein n=1 Tax=Acidovorax sp. GW101-3H11 TaxID=1813946 RepID=UPI0010420A4A|nr:hypothetical protein [Acidovorax sp. GW101-3H11]